MFRSRTWLLLVGIVVVYFSLTFARASTAEPWNDEAWYTAPSLNLLLHGHTGTPYLETTHKFWKGINERTYWVVPLQFFAQVPWIELFGFSLVKMRAFAIFWGLVSILSWAFTVWKITRRETACLLAALFIACDYQFDSQVSLARMDSMALGLASLAVCLYIGLRERNLQLAIFWSMLCVVGSGLTHPTAGVPALTGLIFLILYLDRRRLRPVHALLVMLPFLIGIAFWGWYISAAPDLFKAQFFGNVTDMDRLGGFTHPFLAIWRECLRYWGMSGFAPGMNPLYRIKIFVVAAYLIAAVFLLASKRARQKMNASVLVGLWLTCAVTMTFYDNTKEVKYAIHLVCLYDVLLAIFVAYLWQADVSRKLVAAAVSGAFLMVSIGGLLYTIKIKDDLNNAYLPAAAFINQHAKPNDLILAGSEFGFALGFDRNVVDDDDFTYYSRKQPKFIVISNGYRGFLAHGETAHPTTVNYFVNLLSEHYHRVYSKGEYDIYERNG